ncbi:MAG: ABC transporter permease [Planctomycetota bacterium]
MNETFALAAKDLRLLLRDKVGFFFTFGFPLVFAIFFGTIFGSEGETSAIAIAVVDEDGTPASEAFLADLSEGPELDPVIYPSREAAIETVRRGSKTAFVILPEGFGKSVESVWRQTDEGGLVFGIDPSRRAEAGLIEGLLTSIAYRRLQDVFQNPDRMVEQVDESLADLKANQGQLGMTGPLLTHFLGELKTFMTELPGSGGDGGFAFQPIPIRRDDVVLERLFPKNAFEVSFPQGAIWAVLGCAAAFGISLVVERTRGTLIRLRTAPIRRHQILLGKALACFATTLAAQLVLLILAVAIFDVRPNSYLLLGAAIVSSAIAFVGIMMFLSVLGKTEQSAGGIGWAVLMVLAMIGGGMIPSFVMPTWMASVSQASPVFWSIRSMEGAIWRGFSATEMLVPCGILIGVGALFFFLGSRLFRWEEA